MEEFYYNWGWKSYIILKEYRSRSRQDFAAYYLQKLASILKKNSIIILNMSEKEIPSSRI